MGVHDIEVADTPVQRLAHSRGPIQPPQHRASKVRDLDPVHIDGLLKRHRTVVRTIDVGGEYLHSVAATCQRAAKRMHGTDRTAIPNGRPIGRDDIQNSHAAQPPVNAAVLSHEHPATGDAHFSQPGKIDILAFRGLVSQGCQSVHPKGCFARLMFQRSPP